jgi:hypothetical protein
MYLFSSYFTHKKLKEKLHFLSWTTAIFAHVFPHDFFFFFFQFFEFFVGSVSRMMYFLLNLIEIRSGGAK